MCRTTITHTVEYTLTPEDVATAFVNFDDDSQARILDMIAKGFEEMPRGGQMQINYIARHFFDCECVSKDRVASWLRELIAYIELYEKEPPHAR